MRTVTCLLFATAGLTGCYKVGDLGAAPFRCTADVPDCPDGYHCQLESGRRDTNVCVSDNPMMAQKMSVSIPKSGQYPGTHPDPMIDATTCSDTGGEPNDTFDSARELDTGLVLGAAICPAGDVDYYHFTSAGDYVRVTITYDITVGDLDLAFIDSVTGNVKAAVGQSDGSPKSNGCITSGTSKFNGDVYIAVVGANDMDQSGYSIKLDHGSAQLPCP